MALKYIPVIAGPPRDRAEVAASWAEFLAQLEADNHKGGPDVAPPAPVDAAPHDPAPAAA
jgi:hypothetical protein